MVLSDIDIKAAIQSGDIVIEPFDPSRLEPASYTLSLGATLYSPELTNEIDATSPKLAFTKIDIPSEGYVIRPGDFLLANVAEAMSVSTAYCARLDARTTLARIGLNVLQGSTLMSPGQQHSHETLEITLTGESPVRIFQGMKVVKVTFEKLSQPASRGYEGAYKAQASTTPR